MRISSLVGKEQTALTDSNEHSVSVRGDGVVVSWDDVEKAAEEELNPILIGQSMALAQGDHRQYQELGAGETNFNPLDLDPAEKEKLQKDGKGISD